MLKSEKWFAILSPLSFSMTITSMNLPQTTLYSSAETALMKVKNDLLFWPGLCISPCYLWLKCSLWLCWLVGICPPVLSWFCYFLYLVFSEKCRVWATPNVTFYHVMQDIPRQLHYVKRWWLSDIFPQKSVYILNHVWITYSIFSFATKQIPRETNLQCEGLLDSTHTHTQISHPQICSPNIVTTQKHTNNPVSLSLSSLSFCQCTRRLWTCRIARACI